MMGLGARTLALLGAGLTVAVIAVVVVVVQIASEPPAQSEEPPQAQQEQQPEPEPTPEPEVTVGSDTTVESQVLAELYARTLEENGYDATHDIGIGGENGLGDGLASDELDVVPGYSDSQEPEPVSLENVEMLEPADDAPRQPVVVTTQQIADDYTLTDVADLASVPGVRVASVGTDEDDPLEVLWPLLGDSTGPDDFRPTDSNEAYTLLQQGQVEAITLESYEGLIAEEDLVVLEDEGELIDADPLYPAPGARTKFLTANSDAVEALERVSGTLTTEDVQALVAGIRGAGGDPSEPVAAYYEREVAR